MNQKTESTREDKIRAELHAIIARHLLRLLKKGYSYSEIGQMFCVTSERIKSIKKQLMARKNRRTPSK